MTTIDLTTYTIRDTTVYRAAIIPSDLIQPSSAATAMSRLREKTTVKTMVKQIFGSDAQIDHAADGSPLLTGIPNPPFISISHSSRFAVIAVNPTSPVGVDIEHWRKSLEKVAPRFLTPQQNNIYNSEHLLLCAWTIKEALFKVAETKPERTFIDMPLPPSPQSSKVIIDGHSFSICLLENNPDTCLTLAVRD